METQEIKNIASFWVNRIKHLVSAINMAAISRDAEETINEYQSMLKIQPESVAYSKFNQQFNILVSLIKENFIFEPTHNSDHRILSPDLKKENYNKWLKLRYKIIDSVNLLEKEFDLLVEKNIKAKISVNGIIPTYNFEKQTIFFDQHPIILERDSLEHAFCDVLFNKMKNGQGISWDDFWERMNGLAEEYKALSPSKKIRKQLYDLTRSLNKKVQQSLKNKDAILVKWENQNIVRKF